MNIPDYSPRRIFSSSCARNSVKKEDIYQNVQLAADRQMNGHNFSNFTFGSGTSVFSSSLSSHAIGILCESSCSVSIIETDFSLLITRIQFTFLSSSLLLHHSWHRKEWNMAFIHEISPTCIMATSDIFSLWGLGLFGLKVHRTIAAAFASESTA